MTDTRQASIEDQALVPLFEGLDTPGVSDAMDKLGLHGQALGIMPLANYTRAVVGPAFTVKYVPASDPPIKPPIHKRRLRGVSVVPIT